MATLGDRPVWADLLPPKASRRAAAPLPLPLAATRRQVRQGRALLCQPLHEALPAAAAIAVSMHLCCCAFLLSSSRGLSRRRRAAPPASDRFKGSKSISSDMFFGNDDSSEVVQQRMNQFGGSASISSDMYFNRDAVRRSTRPRAGGLYYGGPRARSWCTLSPFSSFFLPFSLVFFPPRLQQPKSGRAGGGGGGGNTAARVGPQSVRQ